MTQLDRVALERVIAVINGKGGVLKTFLTANLSGFFAANGYRVLVVDLDQQGSLARDYGVRDDDDYDHGKRSPRLSWSRHFHECTQERAREH